ncbi:single-stranded DNA-binding protein [Nonlabens ulvanivorans]|uniref:Single-stranded DNA-binding protein n=1 Tax=Nonlabens ulvanivorans TaxID=906888 RepID=A0A081DAQ7_NONUL|nr:single-stranded DNA-binding protein [Nonlabens ulvanivorans]GAK99484.1 single-stranded DNA-binding protein [Nonlabens ulvanivorans]
MSTLRNKVQLIGNLGQTPEIKVLDSGNKLAKFSIATTDRYKNKQGELVNDTQWHNIIAWGKNRRHCRAVRSKREPNRC